MYRNLTFCDNFNNSNTYVLIKEDEAIIIDPSNDIKMINKNLVDKKVVGILLTHGHFDHFKTLEDAIELYKVPCYMHKESKNKLFNLDTSYAKMFGCYTVPKIDINMIKTIGDGDTIVLGKFKIKVMFTPGHTNCSVCYLVDDVMFSGDTLFKMSVGRCDLATGDMLKQKETINMLARIRKDYKVYPGHDDETTLFAEQKNNPYFK